MQDYTSVLHLLVILISISILLQVVQIVINIGNSNLKFKKTVMADLTKLTADVEAETSVDNSVVTLLTNLSAEIKAAGTDQAALSALTDQMEANAAALAAAVAANTPAQG